MRTLILFSIISSMTLIGCSTAPTRGTVFDHEPNSRLIKIHMDHNEIKLSDSVIFTNRTCSMPVKGKTNNCTVKEVARGKVVQILDEHDSLVEVVGTDEVPKGAQAIRADEHTEVPHKH